LTKSEWLDKLFGWKAILIRGKMEKSKLFTGV